MRGVSGRELEILRDKAAGRILSISPETPDFDTIRGLRARGLLVAARRIPDQTSPSGWRTINAITSLGRVVLAASLGSQP